VTDLAWDSLELDEAVALLDDFPARWWIAGGWALELFVGRPIREHEDVDVLVLRSEQLAVQEHLHGWDLRIAHRGRLEPWRMGEPFELPRHSVWARRDPNDPWQIQFLLGEDDRGVWRYRRDPEVTLPVSELGLLSPQGIPFIRPELILLFKAKEPRERDETDFRAVLPALDAAARGRLRDWLPPEHPWLRRL
jgi:hypothetical protein